MRILRGQLLGGEKAKNTEAVIHGDDQNAFAGEMFAVLTRLGSTATSETTTEYPHHDRQFGLGFLCRRPDVESEAILALPRIAKDHVIVMCLLHTAGTEAGSLTHAVPLGCWLRWFPAQRTYRRRSKWDTEEV